MYDYRQFYINGAWVDPIEQRDLEIIDPATEEVIGQISAGTPKDVDRAVAAAREAFASYSQSSREARLVLFDRIVAGYKARYDDMACAISDEMGAPMKLATGAQAAIGLAHFKTMRKILEDYPFAEDLGTTRVFKEPIGVCGFITPWNWPINQVACKVAPALAAGCAMVLKPSEIAPLDAHILAEVFHEAQVPAGVFNLVDGDGPGVGEAIAAHPDIDMVSFTGSTRAGRLVAKAAAESIKRVAQELGGKSANIILADADLARAVRDGVFHCFSNAGQSCNAPTRMLIPAECYEEAVEIARRTAEKVVVGDPKAGGTTMGPVVSQSQWDKIQGLIRKGIEEGAELVCGGPGKPEGLAKGYFVKPTIFARVTNDMTIAREEIFGPVLAMIPYATEDQAVSIANDTPYGLSGYVQSGDLEHARRIAARLRTGMVHVNGADNDLAAPFGGYKQSGNGREWGVHGLEEFLELKAVMGYAA